MTGICRSMMIGNRSRSPCNASPDSLFSIARQLHCSPTLSQHVIHQLLIDLVVFRYQESFSGQALAVVGQNEGSRGCPWRLACFTPGRSRT